MKIQINITKSDAIHLKEHDLCDVCSTLERILRKMQIQIRKNLKWDYVPNVEVNWKGKIHGILIIDVDVVRF